MDLLSARILPKIFIAAVGTDFHDQNIPYYQQIFNVLSATLFYNYLILSDLKYF